jgi:hypothetical protein
VLVAELVIKSIKKQRSEIQVTEAHAAVTARALKSIAVLDTSHPLTFSLDSDL